MEIYGGDLCEVLQWHKVYNLGEHELVKNTLIKSSKQRWDDSDSGIGIRIASWLESESELNRLLNFQPESELESPLPGIGIGIDRLQL